MSPPEGAEAVAANLHTIRMELAAAGSSAELIAVSKYQPVDAIEAAIAAGQRHFGENYVQEASEKWPALRQKYPDICLHGIGALQSNKAAQAVELFDVLHTVSSRSLANRLAALQDKEVALPTLLVQVNTGEEPQKSGVLPAELPDYLRYCRERHLRMEGLMVLPPADSNPSLHFALLHQLSQQHQLPIRSMGMSDDWRLALPWQPRYIRVGSAIFGTRPQK